MQENLKLKIKEVVENNEFHQAVLDIGYKWWNETLNDPNNTERVMYLGMINHMNETYGWEAAFLILVGKYNYQVNNGGHMQYFDNGYTDGVTGFADDHDPEMPLHKQLIEGLDKLEKLFITKYSYSSDRILTLRTLRDILIQFLNIDIDEDEYIEEEVEYEDDEGYTTYETERNRNDNYGYITDNDLLKELDVSYYKINEQFMDILNTWVMFEVNNKGE